MASSRGLQKVKFSTDKCGSHHDCRFLFINAKKYVEFMQTSCLSSYRGRNEQVIDNLLVSS